MEPSLSVSAPQSTTLSHEVIETARGLSGWLTFIGVVTLLSAIPMAMTIFGIVVAWIPAWLGLLLLQAAGAARAGNERDLIRMLRKLNSYFVIQGLLILLGIAAVLIFTLFFGAFVIQALEILRETAQPMLEA